MTSFSDLDLDPKVLEAISEAGYTSPTPIQEQAIPHALVGRDVLGIAQTGTGKTASFTLPMITILAQGRAKARMPRSLILCPTRELAAQVAENFEIYGKHHRLTMALLIGGVSFKDQDKLIDRGVDVLIATPGRLLDHFERGKLMLTGVQIMVVDEADRMLDMGFIPDIERIFGLTPFTRQTLFFSATMAPEITRLTETFLHNPVRVEVARQATASDTIEQRVCKHIPTRKDRADTEKREVLRRIMQSEGDELRNAIIFCNRKRDVDVLFKSLEKHGFNVGALHGDLDQAVRTRVLNGFRDGSVQFLVASDVAARGLDIPNVSHVFNFDVPIHSEDYVHRIGRTGRAGRKGRAITICLPHEAKYLAQIEDLVKSEIPVVESPLAGGEAESFRPEATDRREKDGKPARPRRERKPRSRGRDRDETQAAEAPAEAPVEAAAAEAPAAPVVAEEPAAQAPAPAPARQEPEERGRGRSSSGSGSGSRGRGKGGREAPVIGLGDHVPAFLLREFKVKPSRSRSEAEAEEEDATA
ncbi:DEAD/DEAH box helicase [Paroceanicella profunda]|uniref:DEAD-box ATP-dependent RNA helicase RhpA n=1 Tax=Paroceanicella profunda TaxID=2579971 RepID=A0A5B8G1B5_9RHOB|nr:DEAD/DEAH box helicase [Paroceanicella profunda]QDL92862.1 DEAD/DEAH box helicase [Paroceanicella profunda]